MWNYMVGVARGERKFRFFWVVLGVSLVSSAVSCFHLAKSGRLLAGKLPEYSREVLDEVYPNDLEIQFKDGVAISNVTEPYFIKVKVSKLREVLELFDPNGGKSLPKKSEIRILTIDSSARSEDFDKYQTMALLSRDRLYYLEDNDVKGAKLDGLGEVKITKAFLNEKLEMVLNNDVVRFFVRYGAFLLIPLVIIFVWGANILYALFMGLLVYGMGRLMLVKDWKYKRGVIVAVMVFFGYEALEAIGSVVTNGSLVWQAQIVSNIWKILGFGIVYLILRKANEKIT